MNAFNRKTATRIAAVSLLLAAVASPLAWFVARENAEQGTVALAIEESQRLIRHFDAMAQTSPEAAQHAANAAQAITGGLFDIAEIYDSAGRKLAEHTTPDGHALEKLLPSHGRPAYAEASYESVRTSDGHQLHCDVGQGYLWSKPVPVQLFLQWAQAREDATENLPAAALAPLA